MVSWFSRFPSVRIVLLVVLATVFVPLLLLFLKANQDQRALAVSSARQRASAAVTSTVAEEEQHVRNAQTLLNSLQELPLFGPAQHAQCERIMRRIAGANEQYTNIGTVGTDGRVACNNVKLKERTYLGGETFYRRALAVRGFGLGDYRPGQITRVPNIVAALAVYRTDGSLRGMLTAGLDLAWLSRTAKTTELPAGSVLAMLDTDGTILFRSPGSARYVGRKGTPEALRQLAARASGSFTVVGVDGVRRLYVFRRLSSADGSRVSIVAGIPSSQIFAEADRIGHRNLVALVVTFAIALLLYAVLARRLIVLPVRRIGDAARKLADGDLTARAALGHRRGELGELGAAFDITAAAVQSRDTEMRAAGERELALQAELHQTRRLESVGQLAGGVAHDFNNLLAIIINYTQFVLDDLPERSTSRDDLEEVYNAGLRGAALTRQLLIFSRREVVQPVVMDLNEVVDGLEKLLSGGLGGHVELRLELDATGQITADPGHMEQVVVNLAVNARDAMLDGGRLTIGTANVSIAEEDAAQHDGLAAGDYLILTVTDSGCGMSPEVVRRAFDPFFTTKRKGEGTGLGLATVWGIVNDLHGRILVYSEPGLGTSFKLYFPATQQSPERDSTAPGSELPAGRGEVILVVEDEVAVRRLAERILADAGYSVMSAEDGGTALIALAGHPIELLVTDVIMPHMLGPELVEKARERQPHLKVLYMSGYSDSELSRHGLGDAVAGDYIEKPYTARQLQISVRAALDGGGGGVRSDDRDPNIVAPAL
jgi:signal transduction histidine kinase